MGMKYNIRQFEGPILALQGFYKVLDIPYSLQNNAALYEISLKENSPYIQGRIVKKVALFCRLYGKY